MDGVIPELDAECWSVLGTMASIHRCIGENLRHLLLNWFEWSERLAPRIRGVAFRALFGLPFRRVGRQLTVHGGRAIEIGNHVSVGDGCWIEAVIKYQGRTYSPRLVIGAHVSVSNWSHISCAKQIVLGDGCLVGSKVYIGDHSHGSVWTEESGTGGFPGNMPLADLDSIEVGAGTWICDGAVILGGTKIAAGSVIGANSVVRLREDRAALIAGTPAKVLRYFN